MCGPHMHIQHMCSALLGNVMLLLFVAYATTTLASGRRHHQTVAFFPSAQAPQQGFVRLRNSSGTAGVVYVAAVDDTGVQRGEATLAMNAGETVHFNSEDLENGNLEKGLSGAASPGDGNWRLELESDLDFQAFAYLRTEDGFLASMHDLAVGGDVPIFNPASNRNQTSLLRLVNADDEAVAVTIRGVDDQGTPAAGEVALTIPAGAARMLTATQLESGGEGIESALGDGDGKWRLTVSAQRPIGVMSLLASPTGHLANLSTRPPQTSGMRRISVFSGADDGHRQGFVRVVNHSGRAGEVAVTAIDEDGNRRGPVPLTVAAGRTVHFNSTDLENGNAAKGLSRGVGDGAGDWRLELVSTLRLEVLAYLRTRNGFVTSVHDRVPQVSRRHEVATFNPASNRQQESRLRIVNAGGQAARVTIRGVDDSGAARGLGVVVSVPAGTAKTFGARMLEEGGDGLVGTLGDGVGKWRLTVESDRPVMVLSLLETPGGHLANLSTRPDANDDPRNVYIPDAGLRAAVFKALNKQAGEVLTVDDMAMLHRLEAARAGIGDLRGLQYATGLTYLDITANRISNIEPLAALTSLESLKASGNYIKDLAPLANLGRLRNLIIWRNSLSNVSPLAGLSALVHLSAGGNSISDISPLGGMAGLRYLYLQDNDIADISALANLTGLIRLVLADNRIVDISALARMTALRWLDLEGNRIAHISVLRTLTNIRHLLLSSNRIADISALSGFNLLEELTLRDNQVTDLRPLTAIDGVGVTATVDVRENPLNDESVNTHIPALRNVGMTVQFSASYGDDDDFPNSRLTQLHNGNVLVLHTPDDIAGDDLPFQSYARHVYRWFADEFDYLLFLSNLDEVPKSAGYYGVYMSVMNNTQGLGRSRHFNSRYGSAGKLRGVIHFPYRDGLLHGPGLHELHHAWGNYAVPSAVGGHWGFSSANGQHGGFDRADLVNLGDGRYSAGRFGTFANGGNGVPFSPIELYFAGYVPPEAVPDLWFASDGKWLIENNERRHTAQGHAIFTADDVREYAIEDIIAENGARVPAMGNAPWHHRAAVVLLVDDDHPATAAHLNALSEHVSVFSRPQSDDSSRYNYFEATNGRGTITMDDLAGLRKQTATEPTPPPSFGIAPPPQHCWMTSDGRIVHRPPPNAQAPSPAAGGADT